MDYLNALNDVQRQAVTTMEGPVMVIAGPGSGKTRVLTYRIAYLIQKGVDPFEILALTFTNKAAAEMRERLSHIVGSESKSLWMGTFHSIFARILRIESQKLGYPSNFTIYDTEDAKSVIKAVIKDMQLDDKIYKPNTVLYRISAAKNALINADQYAADKKLTAEDAYALRPEIANIYKNYTKKCFKAGAMDFDDLLLKMYELISKFPEALYKYQHKFRYILIDEYQDTNFAQYLITKMLADVYQNICIVGDDAQSIYSFRGANIQNILNFQKDYPDTKTFKLEQNYRSTGYIVESANKIIQHNRLQLPKKIWTDNHTGDKIRIVKAASDHEEGKWVADAIFELRNRHQLRPKDFAILYRTNAQSRSFEESLRRLNIPYKVYGGLSFYQRKEIKDMLAYFKLVVNPKDDEALRRIINFPVRGIGKTTVDKATIIADQRNMTLWEVFMQGHLYDFGARTLTAISEFVQMIRSCQTLLDKKNAYDVAQHIAKSSGLLKELYSDKTVEGINRYENLQELLNGIKSFSEQDVVTDDALPTDRSLGTYLQNIMLLTDTEDVEQGDDHVRLMTIHAAKGLEFAGVFVVGMEENLFPSMMSMNDREDIEEERRLFYVAVTRAKKILQLSYALTRYKFGQLNYCEPSRFLEELDKNMVEWVGQQPARKSPPMDVEDARARFFAKKPSAQPPVKTAGSPATQKNFEADDVRLLTAGMDVEHIAFGMGRVESIEGDGDMKIANVYFEGIGQKRIMLKFARLKIHSNKPIEP